MGEYRDRVGHQEKKNGFSGLVVLLWVWLLSFLLLLWIEPRSSIKHASTDLVLLCDFFRNQKDAVIKAVAGSLMN